MVSGLVKWILVGYMVTGLVICLLVRLYVYWFGYMVTGLVIILLAWLYGYWFSYMVIGLVM